jgi:uncharacterized protein
MWGRESSEQVQGKGVFSMEKHVIWVPSTNIGLEHLHLKQVDGDYSIDGVVIGINDGDERPFRVWYEIRADQGWKVQTCTLHLLDEGKRIIVLKSDGAGHWSDAMATALPALDGCIDVDITATPFTNTLPIRRLELSPGQSADLLVAFITVPEMQVRAAPQRYTCLERHADGGVYRYESLSSGFTRDLLIDADGLVIEYPGLWKRAENRSS